MPAAAANAAATPEPEEIPVPARGKKKLLILVAIALVVVLVLAGGALWFLKQRAAAQVELDEDGQPVAQHAAAEKEKPHGPPIFVPLDPFVVNLADKDAERYAQIGLTLEVDDPKFAEEMKLYMPAIRNAILMILAHKTAAELLDRAGKEALAAEIMREAVRPMGIEIAPALGRDGKPFQPASPPPHNPVRGVLFASFIVQ